MWLCRVSQIEKTVVGCESEDEIFIEFCNALSQHSHAHNVRRAKLSITQLFVTNLRCNRSPNWHSTFGLIKSAVCVRVANVCKEHSRASSGRVRLLAS